MKGNAEVDRWFGCYSGGRGDLFLPSSNRHPAKMSVALCYRIFAHMEERGWIHKGDLILDPMCGIATTLVCGGSLGYRTAGIELEGWMLPLAEKNIERLMAKMPQAPRPVIVQGDARHLRLAIERLGDCRGAVTSPPYGMEPREGGEDKHPERMEGGKWSGKYSGAVTSPPYAHDASGHVSQAREQALPAADRMGRGLQQADGYGKRDIAQIGNLRDPKGDIELTEFQRGGRETYLSAMGKVYAELHTVLKPGGVVCLVTKNPVKKGAIRRLDLDTIRLMEAAGFELIERFRAMLSEDLGEQMALDGSAKKIKRERMSFFKRLHVRKYPELAVLWEDILFFRKREETCQR